MFTIGEFSKISGLTVKALRFYHEEGVLIPSFVDPQNRIDIASLVSEAKALGVPVA